MAGFKGIGRLAWKLLTNPTNPYGSRRNKRGRVSAALVMHLCKCSVDGWVVVSAPASAARALSLCPRSGSFCCVQGPRLAGTEVGVGTCRRLTKAGCRWVLPEPTIHDEVARLRSSGPENLPLCCDTGLILS